ncbi:hypothetical protein [Legionella longbeachae]|uniref:Uncharacterized protein n=1 Tax=Legionella longbeachae serogroup 1 (strain NSW150) TaxID=661367 RepID=D3HRH2_LEGLN|nr:hypothetical protein [Legionella longbeachae]VEE02004.1 Uncharacterised protein [Legionella oakridgensis]HBD7396746.1 hypothetical protein [Legionella pneumophila]ARB91689.1 hypothetical protein A6J40_05605 [Legionella longbeachae]ARM35167.1 hypothetical protein B0B39_17350 [Legionella longbeachae]EEZ95385.1 conserved hypothetical protein [Legionella longbeachae D-4968]
MKLSESQRLALIDLNQEFKSIIKDQQQDSSSFDNHVNCLKRLEKLIVRWMNFMSPYMSWQLNQAEKLLDAKWNIFKQLKIKSNIEKYKKVFEEANSLFFDEDLKQQMKLAFEGKPVTGIHVNINDEEKSKSSYRGRFFEHTHLATYQINFLDGTELIWYSLEDEKEMQKARQIFEKKVPQPKKDMINEVTNKTIKEAKEPTTDEENSGLNTDNGYSYGCMLI